METKIMKGPKYRWITPARAAKLVLANPQVVSNPVRYTNITNLFSTQTLILIISSQLFYE